MAKTERREFDRNKARKAFPKINIEKVVEATSDPDLSEELTNLGISYKVAPVVISQIKNCEKLGESRIKAEKIAELLLLVCGYPALINIHRVVDLLRIGAEFQLTSKAKESQKSYLHELRREAFRDKLTIRAHSEVFDSGITDEAINSALATSDLGLNPASFKVKYSEWLASDESHMSEHVILLGKAEANKLIEQGTEKISAIKEVIEYGELVKKYPSLLG